MSNKSNEKFKERFSDENWKYQAIGFGFLMYVFNAIIVPIFQEGSLPATSKMLIAVPLWAIGGLLFGLTMHLYARHFVK